MHDNNIEWGIRHAALTCNSSKHGDRDKGNGFKKGEPVRSSGVMNRKWRIKSIEVKKLSSDFHIIFHTNCYLSSIVEISENPRMDERASWIFSRVDERATQMSEWIEERMWLLESVDQEEPGNWSHWDMWPWNFVLGVTILLFGLFIFLIQTIMNGGYFFPPPLR